MTQTPTVTAGASLSEGLLREPRSHLKPDAEPLTSRITAKRARTLNELEDQFSDISARFQSLIVSSGCELFCSSPAPGSWSAAQCLQHLNISSDAYFPIWQQVIASAGPRKTELNAPYPIDFWGRLLSWILEPPARTRSTTLSAFEPVECTETAHVLDGFLDRQQRIIATLRRCRGRAIDKVRMASPVDPRIRYSIWSSFVIVATHQRRHLWQAQNAIATLSTIN